MIKFLLPILIFISFFILFSSSLTLQEIIASNITTLFANRCSSNIRQCVECSYDGCSNILPQLNCDKSFQTPTTCKDCYEDGSHISQLHSVVRMPKSIEISNEFDKSLTCSLTKLDEVFLNGFDNLGSQYFGGSNGLFRIYPGFGYNQEINSNNKCDEDYDPRYRPWYVSATTGAKNVILIIDTSGSMLQGSPSRMEIAKGAAISVVETLGQNDWIGIVRFSGDTTSFAEHLIQANQNNINMLKQYINQLSPYGTTDFSLGFQQAYQIINKSKQLEFGSFCQTIILFLTDGHDSKIDEKQFTAQQLYDMINDLDNQTKSNATIFTYSLGEEADVVIPKQIACQHYGIQYSISDRADPAYLKTKMTSYYTFLAKGITTSHVIWSEPFMSHSRFKGKELISGSLPVYFQQDGTQFLLGVAAVDLLTEELKKDPNYNQILQDLFSKSKKCSKNNFSPCQLEQLRGTDKCNIIQPECVIDQHDDIKECNDKIINNVFCSTAQQQERSLCCPGDLNCEQNSNLTIILAIVIPIICVILIAGIIFQIHRIQKRRKYEQELQQQRQQQYVYRDINNNPDQQQQHEQNNINQLQMVQLQKINKQQQQLDDAKLAQLNENQ